MNHALAEKIGQLFMVGFTGHTIDTNHPLRRDLGEGALGGVILFDRFVAGKSDSHNIQSPGQVQDLTGSLQEMAGGRLLIAVDQEGGKVSRFAERRGFPVTPSAALLGSGADCQATIAAAKQTATMLRRAGVNLNLAPVVDLNRNPDNPIIGRHGRSFSDSAATVAAHAAAWIGEHRAQGIACCLKHFPGHGSSNEDSHLGLVDISRTWSEVELEPYQRLIDSGEVEAIMVGHLKNNQLDRHCPATLSAATLQNLLRKRLRFPGLVLSDDMQMQAITDLYGLEEACCRAIAAGIDLLVIGNNLAHDPMIFRTLHHNLLAATERGELSEERIDQAYSRLQTFKQLLFHRHASL